MSTRALLVQALPLPLSRPSSSLGVVLLPWRGAAASHLCRAAAERLRRDQRCGRGAARRAAPACGHERFARRKLGCRGRATADAARASLGGGRQGGRRGGSGGERCRRGRVACGAGDARECRAGRLRVAPSARRARWRAARAPHRGWRCCPRPRGRRRGRAPAGAQMAQECSCTTSSGVAVAGRAARLLALGHVSHHGGEGVHRRLGRLGRAARVVQPGVA